MVRVTCKCGEVLEMDLVDSTDRLGEILRAKAWNDVHLPHVDAGPAMFEAIVLDAAAERKARAER